MKTPVSVYFVVLLLTSCTATKYLENNAYFYDGTELIIHSNHTQPKENLEIRRKLMEHIPSKHNYKILGSRPGVWFHYIAGTPKKNAFVRQFIKNTLGTPPVFLTDMDPQFLTRSLVTKLNNEGHFKSLVSHTVSCDQKSKGCKVIYSIVLSPPYHLGKITYCLQADSVFAPDIVNLDNGQLIKTGQQYSLDRLKAEISRIERIFRNNGFFFFPRNHLLFEADSTGGKRTIDLALKFSAKPEPQAQRIYTFNTAKIYFGNSFSLDSKYIKLDTLALDEIDLIYNRDNDSNLIKPDFITQLNGLKKGDVFSLQAEEKTRRHFAELNVFHSIRINYKASSPDLALLTPHIFLTPRDKKSFTSEFKVVSKSNGTIGPQAAITFTNRNFLKRAEKFDLAISGSYETLLTNSANNTFNAFEFKVGSTLSIKRLLMPFRSKHYNGMYLPTTKIYTGAHFRNRVDYYNIGSFTISYGYNWRKVKSHYHEFYPVDITCVKTSNISSEFYDLLALNPSLAISLQDQFILSSRYSFTINQLAGEGQHDPFEGTGRNGYFYFRLAVEQSGNVLDVFMKRAHANEERPFQILGSPYAQYLKGDIDLRYYLDLHPRHRIVTNLVTGIGYAYGNAQTIPYVKQYSIGGASSLRAFATRTVGPGSYNHSTDPAYADDSISFTDQYASMKLQGNIEYRVRFSRLIHGALFLDAGNIWTIREDSARPGSQFKMNAFYKQLAVGTGIGLRLDFEVFLIRFDTGMVLRRPDVGWTVHTIDLNNTAWRKENVIFNIGIGYPF
jgi:outer membrane protein insertion porin family